MSVETGASPLPFLGNIIHPGGKKIETSLWRRGVLQHAMSTDIREVGRAVVLFDFPVTKRLWKVFVLVVVVFPVSYSIRLKIQLTLHSQICCIVCTQKFFTI